MALTSEYQYIGRSNAVKDQKSQYSYYILLYAKTSGDTATGRHTVTIKQRLASEVNTFYGYSTIGSLTIAGTTVSEWNWLNIPGSAWNISNLTEGGITYPHAVDLREGSLTIDVGHGVSKDIAIGASWTFVGGAAGWLPQQYVAAEVSATVTLPMIAGASEPSVSASSVEMGKPLTIYTNRIAGSGFSHELTYQFGSTSGTIAENVGDSCSWTPHLDLARQIPSAISGTAIITCTTYAGDTYIGSKQVTVTLTVPGSIVPTATAAWEDSSGAYGLLGSLVQNISKLAVTVSGTGAYGSTIAGAAVSLEGKPYGGGVLTSAGNLSLTVSVTDSRGRVGTAAYTITVAAYAAPSLSLSASRCTANGTADDTGDYTRITVTGHVTQVNGSNTAKLSLNWGTGSETVSLSIGNISYQKGPIYADPNATMIITATLQDKLIAASRTMVLSTGYATLDLLAGGRGISFGKAATRAGFDCAMPAYFSGGLYGIAPDGTVDTRSLFERVAELEAKL